MCFGVDCVFFMLVLKKNPPSRTRTSNLRITNHTNYSPPRYQLRHGRFRVVVSKRKAR